MGITNPSTYFLSTIINLNNALNLIKMIYENNLFVQKTY